MSAWLKAFELATVHLVLGSPVRSGFLSIFDKTGTETGPSFLKYSETRTGTVIDRSSVVFCGFLRSQDQS